LIFGIKNRHIETLRTAEKLGGTSPGTFFLVIHDLPTKIFKAYGIVEGILFYSLYGSCRHVMDHKAFASTFVKENTIGPVFIFFDSCRGTLLQG
jgi:hypothetical protein